MKKRNAFIVIIVLLLLIGVIVGIGAWHTQGFRYWGEILPGIQPQQQKMQISVNGEIFTQDSEFPKQSQLRVDVLGTDIFNVTIIPGEGAYFDFKHNGVLTKFPYIEADYNAVFGVSVGEGYFTINSNNISIKHILERIFPGEEISDISDIDKDTTYFTIKISSRNEVIEISLDDFIAWVEVSIDPPEVII